LTEFFAGARNILKNWREILFCLFTFLENFEVIFNLFKF
jgi:hypothetical protein